MDVFLLLNRTYKRKQKQKICCIMLMFLGLSWIFPLFGSPLDCQVIVGPTPDQSLTEAHVRFSKMLVKRLPKRKVVCRVRFISAWKRANQMFRQGMIDVLFAEIIGDVEQGGITGMPTGKTEGFVIFSPQKSPTLNRLSDLKEKKVGIIAGRFYPEDLKYIPRIKLIEVKTLEQNLKKLLIGRIDATLEYRGDALKALAKLKIGNRIHFGKEFGESYLAYRFQNTEKGRYLMELFNVEIARMVTDGTYRKVFSGVPRRMLYVQRLSTN